jgi:hypothetical protein
MYRDYGKSIKKSIIWLGFIFILSISLFICYSISYPDRTTGMKLGDMDFLAFVGSLLGGFMAMFAALITIQYSLSSVREMAEKQDREKFLEMYPQKVKRIQELRNKLINLRDNELNPLNAPWFVTFKNGIGLEDEAVYISGQVYHSINGLNEFVRVLVTQLYKKESKYYYNNDFNEWIICEGKHDELLKFGETIKDKIDPSIIMLELLKLDLQKKFLNYTDEDN